MTRRTQAFLSFCLYGGASVTYGLAAGAPLPLVLGASVPVVIIAVELISLPLKSPRHRRRLLSLAEFYDRRRRLFVVAGVALVGMRAIQCIIAVARHDWRSLLYAAVTALALVG